MLVHSASVPRVAPIVGLVSEWIEVDDPDDAGVRWRFERAFVASNWTCTWGRGCEGILDAPSAHLQQGCCSVGAMMADETEAMTIAASAAAIPPHLWQFHDRVDEFDVFRDASLSATKLADGACIFLNRPGFAGGVGCALHLAAVEADESPLDWKPSVCWQFPMKVEEHGAGPTVVTVRATQRADWGDGGATMAWCCTDQRDRAVADAFCGDSPVVESLRDELVQLAGESVWDALRHAVRSDQGA